MFSLHSNNLLWLVFPPRPALAVKGKDMCLDIPTRHLQRPAFSGFFPNDISQTVAFGQADGNMFALRRRARTGLPPVSPDRLHATLQECNAAPLIICFSLCSVNPVYSRGQRVKCHAVRNWICILYVAAHKITGNCTQYGKVQET